MAVIIEGRLMHLSSIAIIIVATPIPLNPVTTVKEDTHIYFKTMVLILAGIQLCFPDNYNHTEHADPLEVRSYNAVGHTYPLEAHIYVPLGYSGLTPSDSGMITLMVRITCQHAEVPCLLAKSMEDGQYEVVGDDEGEKKMKRKKKKKKKKRKEKKRGIKEEW
jgi:hypothetical protein